MRDGRRAFIGSQSLRRMELEKRREIGLFVDDQRTVHAMQRVFEQDWALTPSGKAASEVSAGERPSPTAQPIAHA